MESSARASSSAELLAGHGLLRIPGIRALLVGRWPVRWDRRRKAQGRSFMEGPARAISAARPGSLSRPVRPVDPGPSCESSPLSTSRDALPAMALVRFVPCGVRAVRAPGSPRSTAACRRRPCRGAAWLFTPARRCRAPAPPQRSFQSVPQRAERCRFPGLCPPGVLAGPRSNRGSGAPLQGFVLRRGVSRKVETHSGLGSPRLLPSRAFSSAVLAHGFVPGHPPARFSRRGPSATGARRPGVLRNGGVGISVPGGQPFWASRPVGR